MGPGFIPDAAVTDAAGTIINSGVLGALVILFLVLLLLQQYLHRKEMKDERDAHEVTRQAQIAEIRQFHTLGRSIQDQQLALERVITMKTELVEEKLDDIRDSIKRGRAA